MIRALAILAPIVFAVSFASAADVHVYLLGGQSNGTGRGDAAAIPVDSPLADPQTDVAFWYRKTLTSSTNNTLPESQLIDLAPGSGHGQVGVVYPVEFGPEVSVGRTLADALPDQNILVIKGTHGGSNLHTGWSATGTNYLNFQTTVADALAAVDANGDTAIMQGMIWVQGEADAGNTTHANNYQTNLIDLIDRVRDDFFGGDDAPFVLSRLSDNQYTTLGASQNAVRAAQAAIPGLVSNTATVFTDDDALYTTRADIIHLDANGQINLGSALAHEIVALSVPEPRSGMLLLIAALALVAVARGCSRRSGNPAA